MMSFMPTGGISPANMKDYLAFDKIVCVGGSWMIKKEWIENNAFEKIEEASRNAVELVKEARG
jgi:2-dehydro-3-deoxyphosphogluconate aldolase/(4S)-4-hydroxy-2-oxoglutarate aldolase